MEFFFPAAMCWQLRRPLSTFVLVSLGLAILVLGLFTTVRHSFCCRLVFSGFRFVDTLARLQVADEVCTNHIHQYGKSTSFCDSIGSGAPAASTNQGESSSHAGELEL